MRSSSRRCCWAMRLVWSYVPARPESSGPSISESSRTRRGQREIPIVVHVLAEPSPGFTPTGRPGGAGRGYVYGRRVQKNDQTGTRGEHMPKRSVISGLVVVSLTVTLLFATAASGESGRCPGPHDPIESFSFKLSTVQFGPAVNGHIYSVSLSYRYRHGLKM